MVMVMVMLMMMMMMMMIQTLHDLVYQKPSNDGNIVCTGSCRIYIINSSDPMKSSFYRVLNKAIYESS